MKLLAIDTSTLVASVAVVDGARVLSHVQSDVSNHSDNLLVLVDEVLSRAGTELADVQAVVVGVGPGSFTGLRIGMSTTKGLAFAADKPLWGVSSLAAVALDIAVIAGDEHALYVPVVDARRKEVFAGFYRVDENGVRSVAAECVLAPTELAEYVSGVADPSDTVILGGDASELYPDGLSAAGRVVGGATTPLATRVATVCQGLSEHENILVSGAPVYIRASEAEIKFPKGNPGGSFSPRDK